MTNPAPAPHSADYPPANYPPTQADYPPPDAGYEEVDADDLDLLAERRFKPTKMTLALIALIAAAVAFGGGVLVQKHYGTSSSAAAGDFARAGAGARASGAGGFGGYAGFGGQAGGFGPGGTGQAGAGQAGAGQAGAGQAGAGQTATGQTGSSASSTPVVVGTITKISGSTLTVKNFGGKSLKVSVPQGAAITFVAGSSLPSLKTGNSVSVAGTTNSDGSIKATVVTVTSS